MSEEEKQNTELRILDAAMQEFIQKGKAGARMQAIANAAGINKALLHYYYRSKDKLFEAVFTLVVKQLLLPKIMRIMTADEQVFTTIRKFTDFYVGLLIKNPYIPLFVLEEISKNPSRLSSTLLNSGMSIEQVLGKFSKAMDSGLIRRMDPRHIFINIISLCIFPVVAKNMVSPILFQGDDPAYRAFIESRKTEVANFIIQAIKTDGTATQAKAQQNREA